MTALPGQSMILSGGYSPWQAPLAALFSGLSAAGQPGGWSNFGQGVGQGVQNFQAGQQNQQMMQLRQMQIQQAEEEARRANQEEAQRQATIDRLRKLGSSTGSSTTPVQPVGNYGAATGGIQTASGSSPLAAMFQTQPQLAELYNGYLDAGDTEGALKLMSDLATQETEKPKAASEIGQIMADVEAGFITPAQAQERINKMNYIAPQAPAAESDVWEQYVDPVSKRTGQRNKKTGKIDWDPGNTMMVQTGTDQNGNPIFDMVSTSAGRPPSEANIQAGIRGTLIEGAVNEIRKIANDAKANVSALRMAAADAISEKGPLGAYGANVLRTDDEKKYSASIAKGVEGLVAAITGAGVAMSQFPRIQQLIPGPTDNPEIVNWKLDQLVPILDTMLAASGPLALTKKATQGNTNGDSGEIIYDAQGNPQ